MKALRNTDALHPILAECTEKIQKQVIQAHKMPFRLFEAGRTHERHEFLLKRGKTKDVISRHLFNLENDPPLYATAVDYVFYKDNKWSWNLRDSTIVAWYQLFGNLVLDVCPELEWGGQKRKSVNYCHFQLRHAILVNNLDTVQCVVL